MKKQVLILSSILLPLASFAQESVEPKMVEGVYALKISPNGKWVGSMAGDASIYNVQTGENVYYSNCLLGLGNTITDDGLAVGDANDVAALMKDGNIVFPESIGGTNYWFSDINAVTPDGSRICGILNNEAGAATTYVPFVADIDASGNVSEPTILPFPELDLFGAEPEFVTAVWISRDGKTVLGQVLDWRGQYTYPIYFTQADNGEWDYSLPSKSLFNPTGIVLPENPWLDEPEYPTPENFMTGARRQAYLEALENYSNGTGPEPFEADYMTPQEYEDFLECFSTYNAWYYANQQEINDYIVIYKEVLKTSPSFFDNEMALDPSGNFFMMRGGVTDAEYNVVSKVYKFGISDDSIEIYDTPTQEFFPSLILPNGTVVITKGQVDVPTSYLMLPGTEEFISMPDYFKNSYPSISEWMEETLPGGTGVVSINDSMTVFTGGLIPDQLETFDQDSDMYYSTYFILLGEAGIESIVAEPADGVYKVFNLNGVKVMETKDSSKVNSLPAGLYIVNGKKILLAK